MASLENRTTRALFHIPAQCIVGRAAHCNLRLDSRVASGVHAEIRWTGRCWELRDLSSRNGTFVNRRRLAEDERVELRAGMAIAFGDPDDPYQVVSTAPPVARAWPEGRARSADIRAAEDGLLLLPSDDAAEHTIFEDPPGTWWAEDSSGARQPLQSGELLSCGSERWVIELPLAAEATQKPDADRILLEDIGLRFAVSRNQEYIEVTIITGDKEILLPPRAHNELLLALARARLEDRESPAISEREAGWRYNDALCVALAIDYNLLNQHKSRARKQLAEAKTADATRIFEMRPSTRQIRLGVGRIEILIL